MDEHHINAFREEAGEILTDMESWLLELEENPNDAVLIDRVFGAIHTIKGTGSMFGFDAVADFSHEIETVLDVVRDGIIPVTPRLISLTLSARDKIQEMLDNEIESLDNEAVSIIADFHTIFEPEDDARETRTKPTKPSGKTTTFRIRFKPKPEVFATGTNPLLLLDELREMGECTIVAQTDAIPFLDAMNPEACMVSWEIILTTEHDEDDVRDVFIFVEGHCELSIEKIFEHVAGEEIDQYKRLGEILLDRGNVSEDKLRQTLAAQKKLGERLVEAEVISPSDMDAALSEQEHFRKVLHRERNKKLSSIRVDSNRLDHLVDLVGELVTVQARLTQKTVGEHDPELQLIAEAVERLTEELRDTTMSIRMVPIGTIFSRFRRLIHDLSEELGKQVQMTMEGAATELDKSVIDQLNEPLIHIIRNAIDHGIEPPAVREALNKPVKGSIQLTARHAGAYVVISIIDDGAGLDADRIRAKAVERGLVSPDADISDSECFDLILQPGFTTTEEITGVSGRGVGMDVVKRSVDNLRGTTNISSIKGSGTTISLHLPLTLAIIDGLLVKISQDLFVIPLSAIEECIELTRDEAARSRERSMMTFRDKALPYLDLRAILEIDGEYPDTAKVVLVNALGKTTGFAVDQVIGQHQTVIKTLNRVYGNVEGISGATILGDGTVALILDANQLVKAGWHDSPLPEQPAQDNQSPAPV